jgi:nucleotide-binding universal stress UspA family protein
MFEHILVPLDGSARAERALVPAAGLVRATHGELTLVRVINIQDDVSMSLVPAMYAPVLLDDARAAAASYLGDVSERAELAGISIKTYIPVGSAASTVLDLADDTDTDAIVLTSHGRTGLTRWMLGSVAHHIVRHAKVPVLVLRDGGPLASTPSRAGTWTLRVLATLDGSRFAEEALPHAVALASALNSPGPGVLRLLLVVPSRGLFEDAAADGHLARNAEDYLKRTAEHLTQEHAGLAVTWSVAVESDAAAGIIRVAEHRKTTEEPGGYTGCDVIVVASHGRSGLARWTLGSVAERVLQGTKLPVLVVRPRPVAEPEQRQAASATDFAPLPPLF